MNKVLLYVIFIFEIIVVIDAAKILALYPCPSISHQVVFRALTSELLKNGHEVTVATPDPMFPEGGGPPNLIEIEAHELYSVIRSVNRFKISITGRKSDLIGQMSVIKEFIINTTQVFVRNKKFQDLVMKNNSTSYDLILIEALYSPLLAMTHIFKAPSIMISSFAPFVGNYEIFGAPTRPLLYHNMFSQRLYNLTLWEKINELYFQLRIKYVYEFNEDTMDDVVKNLFGSDIPPLSVLKNNVDLLFLNMHTIWEGNYPVPPNVIHLGGLHQKPPKPLPTDLQEYLDASYNGVIYCSFGTNVNTSMISPEKISVFEKVFSELQYNVIWKFDTDLTNKPKNIKTFKWLPQADILRHRNVKVFIMQGGLQSTDEAITGGVPLIGIPMLGDQWYNVEKYVHLGIGVRLYLEDVTEDSLKSTILEVAEGERYRNNIVRLRLLMEDQPQKPLERAMWWINYLLRHGDAKHMRAPAANISWTEYYELELVGVIIGILLVKIALMVILKRFLMSLIYNKYLKNDKLKKS